MSETDYADILEMSWEDIPEPKLVPDGSWLFTLKNASYQPPKGDASPRVMFVYSPKEPMDDVDAGELEKLGDYDYTENRAFHVLWLETKRDWDNVRKHLTLHGLEPTGNIVEYLKTVRSLGGQVVAYVTTDNFKNKDGQTVPQNRLSNFTKFEG